MKTKIILFAAMFLFTLSCTKDSATIDQTSVEHADYDALTDAVFEDVFNTADNATIILDLLTKGADSKSGSLTAVDSCPVITITRPTGAVWPRLVKIDYGTACAGINENTRSGKIMIEVTGPRLQTGSKRTVTFIDYYFNGIKVEGTKVLENNGFNSNQNLMIHTTLTNGKLTFPDGRTIERTVNHQREWTAGLLTRNIWDDECLITGTAGGKNIKGMVYTNTILTPLNWKRACRFLVAGVIKMERSGVAQSMEINYGSGDCDAKAVVTRGDQSKEILLRSGATN